MDILKNNIYIIYIDTWDKNFEIIIDSLIK